MIPRMTSTKTRMQIFFYQIQVVLVGGRVCVVSMQNNNKVEY